MLFRFVSFRCSLLPCVASVWLVCGKLGARGAGRSLTLLHGICSRTGLCDLVSLNLTLHNVHITHRERVGSAIK